MSATSATLAGRAAANALMVDTCTITADVPLVYDEESDTYVTPAGSLRYSGPCKVKPRDNVDRVVEAGAQTVSIWPYVVSIPMSVTTVELDDVITVTACPLDPALVDTRLRVRQATTGTYLTARRLGCEEQS